MEEFDDFDRQLKENKGAIQIAISVTCFGGVIESDFSNWKIWAS